MTADFRVPAGQRLWVGKEVTQGSRVGQLIAHDPDGDDLTFRLRNATGERSEAEGLERYRSGGRSSMGNV